MTIKDLMICDYSPCTTYRILDKNGRLLFIRDDGKDTDIEMSEEEPQKFKDFLDESVYTFGYDRDEEKYLVCTIRVEREYRGL